MALSDKRRLFVEGYLQSLNATEAARLAGYSEKTIHVQAGQLRKNPEIVAEIERRIAEQALKADEVLHRLRDHALGSVEEFIDLGPDAARVAEIEADLQATLLVRKNIAIREDIRAEAQMREVALRGELREAKADRIRLNLERAQAKGLLHLVKSLKPTRHGMACELHDSQAALELLGKALRLFVNVNEHSGPEGESFKVYLGMDPDEV